MVENKKETTFRNYDIKYVVVCRLSGKDSLSICCDLEVRESEMYKYEKDLTDTAMISFILYMIDEEIIKVNNYTNIDFSDEKESKSIGDFLLSSECNLVDKNNNKFTPLEVTTESYFVDKLIDTNRFLNL